MAGLRKWVLAATALLSACSGNSDHESTDSTSADSAIEDAQSSDRATMPETAKAPDDTATSNTVAAELTDIPDAMTGRWGLVAADCDPGRSDAKGLLEISPKGLTFYESRGSLRDIVESEPGRIVANFDFSGEGMSWQRRMALDLQDNGATLIRREYGEDAAPGPFKYRKCR